MHRLLTLARQQRPWGRALGHVGNATRSRLQGPTTTTRFYATYKRFNNQVQTSNPLSDPFTKKVLAITIGLGTVIYVSNLEEAPVTGRRRFIWTTESMERWVGDRSYRELLGQYRGKMLSENDPQTRRARKIFEKILKVSSADETKLDWKVHVIYDPTAPPNAFVLPGGKVFVFSSILPICVNDNGLATVLAHEFGHQLARHTGENISSAPIYGLLSLTLYALTGADLFSRLLTATLFEMPASREMETEADYIGLMLMSKACFDPREAPKLWDRMSRWEKTAGGYGRPLEILSTHPASERRIQNMQEWLPEALNAREGAHCGQYGDFMAFASPLKEIW